LELNPNKILIGSNGAEKSNFVSFFKLINAIFNQRLQKFILVEKVDNIIYFKRKTTESLFGKLNFSNGLDLTTADYFHLSQVKEGGLFIEK
jgi:predicted ATPase